ncbi:ABC transporter substrate-binding protein [Paenibacillus thalictri]|uniref:Extracellular solute-binding protein n=1 Tax=Paenibacillus thalictri TaxID=2527873 RepID=A0A4Q9DR83_9BACL|nr:extracellular solute-binding protein [Paenibacillus thalictri]TBL77657.1 extracellular solute-binding protein [Paenibacillus thalictri]
MFRQTKWSTVLSVLTACSLLAACSSNGGTNSSAPSAGTQSGDKPKEAKVVKLKFWGGVPPEAGPQQVIDKWNKENPNIQVEYVRYVNDDPGNLKLDTALMTGQGVDLFMSYFVPRLEKRVRSGNALDLGQFSDYNIEAKIGPAAKDWQIDGKNYSIPTTKKNFFIWLNKQALDEVGLPVPTDWTWEDVQAYADKLKKGQRQGFLQTLTEFDYPMDGSIEGSGGNVKPDGTSNLGDPYAKKYLEIMYNMMFNQKSTPALGEQIANKMPTEAEFLKGNAGIFYAGSYIFRFSNNLKDYPRDFKIAFAPMPKVSKDQSQFKVLGGVGDALSINAASPYKEEAWKFMKWYADGGILPMAEGGRIPASKEIDKNAVSQLLTKGAQGTYDLDSMQKVLFDDNRETFELKLEQQVIDIRKEEYQKYFTKAQSLDETINRIVKRHNDYLTQKKK